MAEIVELNTSLLAFIVHKSYVKIKKAGQCEKPGKALQKK